MQNFYQRVKVSRTAEEINNAVPIKPEPEQK